MRLIHACLPGKIQSLFEVFMVDSGDTPPAGRYARQNRLIWVYTPSYESVFRLLRIGRANRRYELWADFAIAATVSDIQSSA
jgi:hypothetical protein